MYTKIWRNKLKKSCSLPFEVISSQIQLCSSNITTHNSYIYEDYFKFNILGCVIFSFLIIGKNYLWFQVKKMTL